MAANFWLSTHNKYWLFSKEKINDLRGVGNAKDRQVFSVEERNRLLVYYTRFIHRLARDLKLRQRVIATASVYLQRFYVKNNLLHFDPRLIAPCMVYLAVKVEECHVNSRTLLSNLRRIDPGYPYEIKDLLEAEFFILEELDCKLVVFHPYRSLQQYLSDAGFPELLKTAWFLVNDSYQTDMHLTYPPYLIGLACIYMAAAVHEKDMKQWFSELISVDMKEISDIIEEMIDFYNVCRRIDERELELLNQRLIAEITTSQTMSARAIEASRTSEMTPT